jgi:hypothetical protein
VEVSREMEEVGGGKVGMGQVLVVRVKAEVVGEMEEVGEVMLEVVREMGGEGKVVVKEMKGLGKVERARQVEGVEKQQVVREMVEVEMVEVELVEVEMVEVEMVVGVRKVARAGLEGKAERGKCDASFSSLVSSLCGDAACSLCGGRVQCGPKVDFCHLEFFPRQSPRH